MERNGSALAAAADDHNASALRDEVEVFKQIDVRQVLDHHVDRRLDARLHDRAEGHWRGGGPTKLKQVILVY